MDVNNATIIFDALSQETRLNTFRILVKAGPEGLPAGAVSDELGIPHNTLSFHLNHLFHAGIVSSKKKGRSVIYSANFELMQEIIGFMVEDCCSQDFANIRKDKKRGCSVIELPGCC